MFEVFDKKYESKVDAAHIGDMLRCLGIAVTNAECEKKGQTPKPGKNNAQLEPKATDLVILNGVFNVSK